jgi:hypothetical protein
MLFGTSGCHLCEQAESIINECVQDGLDLTIENIDIAGQEQWQGQYAIRIPVLFHPETRQELGWPFDQAAVKEFVCSLSSLAS